MMLYLVLVEAVERGVVWDNLGACLSRLLVRQGRRHLSWGGGEWLVEDGSVRDGCVESGCVKGENLLSLSLCA